ncbi:hypothetical protein F5Y13DRAFT_202097 [Hypoxylon sp. FL1857]|nr:hypothetical protein F5Y13DRAFT_202097 [Hypoxylon sp. FL1857]
MATTTTTTTSFRKTTLSHAQKTVLAMSRAQYLDAIRNTRPADKLYVGVCIFRMDAHSSRPSVLLLRRSASSSASSASESSSHAYSSYSTTPTTPTTTTTTTSSSSRWRDGNYNRQLQRSSGGTGGGGGAGIWELPGGKVGDGDFCISAAVARRVAEQTGLRVVRVLGALQDVRRISEVRILDWDDDGMGIFTGGDSVNTSSNISVLDGATLTSGTNSSGVSGSSSSGGSGGTRNSGNISRRSPIHNPQLILRKECLQLNYAVLVQSHEGLAIRSREHDEMVWASFSRAEALNMPEELRTVVHQGLAFAGEYLF